MSERLMAAIAFAPVAPALAGLVARAGNYAGQQGHRSVKLEHLLFALSEDGEAVHLLETCGVDVSRLRTEIAQYLDHHEDRDPSGETRDPPPHGELIRAIQHGAAAARGRTVTPSVVLAAIVGEGTTTSASLLSVQGFSFQAAVTALQQIAARARAQQQAAPPPQPMAQPQPVAPPPQPVAPPPQLAPPPQYQNAPAHAAPQPIALRPVAPEPAISPAASAEDLIETARRRIETARQIATSLPTPSSAPQGPPPGYTPVGQPAAWSQPTPPQATAAPTAPPSYAPPHPEPVATERTYPPHRELSSATQRTPAPVPPQPSPVAPYQPVPPPRAQLHPAPPGDYARPPAPRLEQAPPRRASPATQPPAASAQPQHARTIEIGRLIENVPRKATVGEARTVEVRLRRAEIAAYTPSHSQRVNPDGRLIHAVCVRLRAPDGGLLVETLSPETAWLDANSGGLADEFATWRWRVTPAVRGRRKLVLGVTVRRVGEEGLTAETSFPEQVFEVAVAASVGRTMTWAGGLAAALAAGFVAGFFGNAIVSGTLSAIARIGAG